MHSDSLSIQLAALADPTRRAILARLSEGETSVKDLAAPFAMSLPAISRHLKVLANAGLVSRSRAAQWRPAKLEPLAMKAVAEWIDRYRRFWEPSFERLDAYLKSVQSGDDDGAGH